MIFILSVICIFFVQPVYAYVGPGLGVGAIGTVLGVVGAFFLALFAVIYYPIKRVLKKWKTKQEAKKSKISGESKK